MPASMMSADTGGSTKVAGSSIGMVAIGPMPGSTPIRVPRMQPMKQYRMLFQCRATPKPSIRFESNSKVSPQERQKPTDDCSDSTSGQSGIGSFRPPTETKAQKIVGGVP